MGGTGGTTLVEGGGAELVATLVVAGANRTGRGAACGHGVGAYAIVLGVQSHRSSCGGASMRMGISSPVEMYAFLSVIFSSLCSICN